MNKRSPFPRLPRARFSGHAAGTLVDDVAVDASQVISSFGRAVRAITDACAAYFKRQVTFDALSRLDNRTLRDIGVDRSSIAYISRNAVRNRRDFQ